MESHTILIKQATIIDPNSAYNGQKVDILIKEDTIVEIAKNIEKTEHIEIFQAENLHVSPGWFDLRANFCDPGHEEKEDIESGINAAIFGGFTSVALSPNTKPAIDSKADIEYIYKKAENLPVNVFPYGAITKAQEGKELSEMYDMYQAGAVGFSTGQKNIDNSALVKLALQYVKNFAPPIHLWAMDEHLAHGGQMHEGANSTALGLKGIPDLAEEISILRDLKLANYAETSVHLMGISSQKGLDVLNKMRESGSTYTCDIAAANLYFTDDALENYDTRLKVLPPLRSTSDKKALIEGLKNGSIQAICSNHSPEDIENKKCEFENASFGIIGLETFIGSIGKALDGIIPWSEIIKLIAINPREILQLETPIIEEGNWAELTFFDPDKEWIFNKEHIQSKSSNTPFLGKEMKGKALGIFNNGVMVWMG